MIDTHNVLTLNSQPPHPLLKMWVVPCLSAQVGHRWQRVGFLTRVSLEEKNGKEEERPYSSVHFQHGQPWLSCACYNGEIWLFTDLAISVLLLGIIKSGELVKCKSQFIREELRSFIALLKMLKESGTTFNQASTHSADVRPPIFGIFHFFPIDVIQHRKSWL